MINLKQLLLKLLQGYLPIGNTNSQININFPIGSIYYTSTNTNPGNWLGGTWTLVHKDFAFQSLSADGTNSDTITFDTTNTTVANSQIDTVRMADLCWVRLVDLNINAGSDTTTPYATFNYSNAGFNSIQESSFGGWSDGLNGIALMAVTTGGIIRSYSFVNKGSSTSTSSGYISGEVCIYPLNPLTDKKDTACDLFYWERTA